MKVRFPFAFALLVFLCSTEILAQELQLVRVTPNGEDVPAGREIVFEFDRTMVPLGDMSRRSDEIPITVEPDPGCEWRWLNVTSVACQLGESNPLAPATRYQMRVNGSFRSFQGATLGKDLLYEFVTERPKVTSYEFRTWLTPTTPQVRLSFNQEIQERSARKHLYFQDAAGQRYEVSVSDLEGGEANEKLVTPEDALPANMVVELRVEKGLRPVLGAQAGIEDRVLVRFSTLPEFEFRGVRCFDTLGKSITLLQGEKSEQKCDPLNYIALLFSSPVLRDDAKAGIRSFPDFSGGRTDFDPWAGVYSASSLGLAYESPNFYELQLPSPLKAAESYRVVGDSSEIRDEFGRRLPEPFEMEFFTDHRRPKYHLEHQFSVLESNVESEVPLVITNLSGLGLDYSIQRAGGLIERKSVTRKISPVMDVAYAIPFGMRDLLGGHSGVLRGTISPQAADHLPTPAWSGSQHFFSQVTPFHVHAKLGHFNSMVWVTDLSSGKPVRNAQVEVFTDILYSPKQNPSILAQATSDEFGLASLPGLSKLDPELRFIDEWDKKKPRLFVRVTDGGNIALLPLNYDFRAYAQGAWAWKRKQYGHLKVWGATAQGVYRLGDTLQYKIYVRHQDENAFTPAPRSSYSLVIKDPLDKEVFKQDKIVLSEFGAFDGSFEVPKEGAVGWYRFEITPSFSKERWWPLQVLVSDFTPAPFKVVTELHQDKYMAGESAEFRADAKLHAGGPYADARTRITARVEPGSFRAKDGELSKFIFASSKSVGARQVYQKEFVLDERGELEGDFEIDPEKILYGTLSLEASVQDDRGKFVASRDRAEYFGQDRYVGIRQDDWILEEGKQARFDLVVLDSSRKLAPGSKIQAMVERNELKAVRIKSSGNTYLTRYENKWKTVERCERISSPDPVSCSFVPDSGGSYRIRARVRDTEGRKQLATVYRFAVGKGWNLWESPENTELKIVAEKDSFGLGETARFMVQNPYPGARALITVERYGIQKRWIEKFEGSSAIVSVPITEDQVPGFYLSVVLMSPRVAEPLGDGNVDLGKPVFRMGYLKVGVSDEAKRLGIEVRSNAEEYRPGDKVTLQIRSSTSEDSVLPPLEYAVTVLDEAVFDLLNAGRDAFDPYEGFYSLDALDVDNFNLLKMLVGRQKFEKKGAQAGGDGVGTGKLDMRSLFKFVSYWNPSVRSDLGGQAEVSFTVPDNLTAWKVFVIAMSRDDLMGLGESKFRVNKPTEIRPSLPNQILEGDTLQAKFTVMNRTEQSRTIRIQAIAKGSALTEDIRQEQMLELAPFKRQHIEIPLEAKRAGNIDFELRAKDALDSDGLVASLPVGSAYAMHTAGTYGSLAEEDGSVRIPVVFPSDIFTDRGGLAVISSASLLPTLSSAFAYMRDYPYECWEQKLTKGVVAAQYLELRGVTDPAFVWNEAKELPDMVLKQAGSYQAPSGGMAYYQAKDEYVSPYLSAYTALAFGWLRKLGYQVPEPVEQKLDEYLLRLLKRDVLPGFYSEAMAYSVRAVALAALSERMKVSPSDLSRYSSHMDQMDLFGKAHFLHAATALGVDDHQKRSFDAIMGFSNQSGGKLTFTEREDPDFLRIHGSHLRTNCAVLSGFVALSGSGVADSLGELPILLARQISQRITAPHGELNTQEVMFCMNALIDYQQRYEQIAPEIDFSVNLDGSVFGSGTFRSRKEAPLRFELPLRESDPGRRSELEIHRAGRGRLYYGALLNYAPIALSTESTNAGMDLWREYSVERDGKWKRLDSPFEIKVGELVRVDLFLSLPAVRNFVVLDDPVPGGLEPVNRDLATASLVDVEGGDETFDPQSVYFQFGSWLDFASTYWNFYHRELRNDSVRFYSEHLEAGQYHVAYTAQAIAPGAFAVRPPKAVEMYQEDVYGMGVEEKLVVTD